MQSRLSDLTPWNNLNVSVSAIVYDRSLDLFWNDFIWVDLPEYIKIHWIFKLCPKVLFVRLWSIYILHIDTCHAPWSQSSINRLSQFPDMHRTKFHLALGMIILNFGRRLLKYSSYFSFIFRLEIVSKLLFEWSIMRCDLGTFKCRPPFCRLLISPGGR